MLKAQVSVYYFSTRCYNNHIIEAICMRYEKNAFTLIELMGVIIIMGIILVIVFPSTVRLINNNSDRKFNTYYDLIENAAALYARDRRDDLGGVTASGCIENVTLKTLIDEEYIKKFDDKEITCGTPSEFALSSLKGIDTTKNYVDIRIRNTRGKITSEISLICVKKNKVVYSNLIVKQGSCTRYVP